MIPINAPAVVAVGLHSRVNRNRGSFVPSPDSRFHLHLRNQQTRTHNTVHIVFRCRPRGHTAALTVNAARRCCGSRTKARPESYGTLSHLWQSVAQESASATPAVRCARAGAAAAHNPNAPST